MPLLRLLAALLPGFAGCAFCSPSAPAPASAVWSFTDLDGDLSPDMVRSTMVGPEARGFAYTVEFQMSAGRLSKPIRVHARDVWGLQIVPRDVDGDHDLDLVVTTGAYAHAVGVWLNDGKGGFTSAGILQFPASIWQPGHSLGGLHNPAPFDGGAILSSYFSAVLAAGGLPVPVRADGSQNVLSDAVPGDFPLRNHARPRAPPAG